MNNNPKTKLMGQAKKQMMEDQINDEIVDFLESVIESDQIENSALGIAKQAIDRGMESLTEKQTFVIEKFIKDFKKENICKDCEGDNVDSLADYLEVADEGICFFCRDRRADMDKA